MIDPLLMTATRVLTFHGQAALTNATGFFYERDSRLFLVTSRHVVLDEASEHRPDRLQIHLHIDANDIARTTGFAIPLYRNGEPLWREAGDRGGAVDVAAIELDREALPDSSVYRAFSASRQPASAADVEIGTNVLILGFPLGFHDTLHRMPIARHAIVSSSFGLRFQGLGYFLTDGRTHRGISGAPVVMRDPSNPELPWTLLGVHSTRLDIASRDLVADEALGLNCAWYADILETLTES